VGGKEPREIAMTKEALKQLREVHAIQGRKGCWDIDDYMLGLYNGLELALSIVENRECRYKYRPKPQPEQERCVGCEACIDTACGRDECPKGWPKAAQPEQKPFAWYAIEHGEADIEWNSQRPIYEGNWKPLYRTPPQRTEQEQQIETLKRCLFQMQEAAKDLVKQAKSLPSTQRKPLTDEQIYEMYNEPRSDAEMLAFARAIEAAHGIKE